MAEEKVIPLKEGQILIRFVARTGKRGRPKEDFSSFIVRKVNEDGTMLLEYDGPKVVPEEIRRQLANEIVSIIEPSLKEQVGKMVEDSLTQNHKGELEKIKKEIVEKKEEPKLKSKPGCVFLEIGGIKTHL